MTDVTVADTPAEPVVTAPDPAAVVQSAEPVITAPEPTPEPEPQPAPRRPSDTFINTITGLRADRRNLSQENDNLKRQLADAQALADRLSRTGTQPDGSPIPAPVVTPRQQPTADDAEINRRAAYQVFARDVQEMQQHGLRHYGPTFNESVRVLEAIGATDDAFVSEIMAVDRGRAHELINKLAEDAERTLAIVGMTPAARIAELTRMSLAMGGDNKLAVTVPAEPPKPAAPARKVSAAPPPAPALEPSTSTPVDWRTDKASDADFSRGWDQMMAERAARARGHISR